MFEQWDCASGISPASVGNAQVDLVVQHLDVLGAVVPGPQLDGFLKRLLGFDIPAGGLRVVGLRLELARTSDIPWRHRGKAHGEQHVES